MHGRFFPPCAGACNVRGKRRRLGQHLLRDPRVTDQIVEAVPPAPAPLLEVGPGDGALTERLARLDRPLAAIELDPAMAHRSRRRLEQVGASERCAVLEGDILDADPAEALAAVAAAPPYGLVGNLPYAITSPLLRRFLSGGVAPPEFMVVMVQWEVARQMCAPPGKRSLLSIAVQFYAEAELLFAVEREAFQPPPEVRSAVVRLTRRAAPPTEVASEERFFEVVRAGFRTPRKQLHNSLSQGIWLDPGGATPWLEACGIDPARRAGTLTMDEWGRLAAYREARMSGQTASGTGG